jgi:hypothetical protein
VASGKNRTSQVEAFRERARLEADRYGPDPWVFVRELLQNARDAGAQKVRIEVADGQDGARISCHDDGEGMTLPHARRYLFALYASSKEGIRNQAGQFGVGFWSVLRFEPHAITVRSHPRGGQPWGVLLDGALEHATALAGPTKPGTEIVLERPAGDGMLPRRIRDAAWQSARYLCMRDHASRPLEVRVNGELVTTEFALDAPCSSFRRGKIRGVVGLGKAPRVELFSRGLRVRSAACLEDLLAPTGHTGRTRVHFPELPEGRAPQALLDSDALDVMLARRDTRETRALRRLVRLAGRELRLLVERQLSFSHPVPLWRRGFDWIARGLRQSLALRTAAAAAVGATVALAVSFWIWGTPEGPRALLGPMAATPVPPLSQAPPTSAARDEEPVPYDDLGRLYHGPQVDVLGSAPGPVPALRYVPAEARPRFAALVFERLAPDGAPVPDALDAATEPYPGTICEEDCIQVALVVRSEGGRLRIPVPTGHRVVEGTVRIDDEPVHLVATSSGQPLLALDRPFAGILRYFTGPARRPHDWESPSVEVQLPAEYEDHARSLAEAPVGTRVQRLLALTRNEVDYDRSREVADRHELERAHGRGFVERTIAIGKGDCDIQNSLLVVLLRKAGVPARLAVGYLGEAGMVVPRLHAWAEYLNEHGEWRIADASTPQIEMSPGTHVEGGAVDDDRIAVAAPGSFGEEDPRTQPPPSATTTGPASTSETDDGTRWLVLLVAAPLLIALIVLLVRPRTRRSVQLDQSRDLSELLQGALEQPGAFSHLPALFLRPMIPLLDGRTISLQRARERSTEGRLYRTQEGSTLARHAKRRRAAVLDASLPEGRTVADALGAIDLDRWDSILARSSTIPVLDAVNQALRDRGEDWAVRVVPDLPEGLASLDLLALDTRRDGIHGSRVVVLDARGAWLEETERRFSRAPRATVFAALDHIAERVNLPDRRRADLLAASARDALLEACSR